MDAGYLHLRSGQGYCGPGSTQGYARNRAGLYVRGDEGVVTTFRADLNKSGQAYLPPHLDIAGTRVWPTFLYTADQAAAGTWTATVGENLTLVDSGGTEVALDQGSPLGVGGGADTSVLFAASGDYYTAAASTVYPVTTEDMVIEAVFKAGGGASTRIATKRSTAGWALQENGSDIHLFLDWGATSSTVASDPITVGAWYHVMFFADRSGSAVAYVNGAVQTVATDISSEVATDIDDGTFTIGDAGANNYDSNIGLVAMWASAGWLDTHLQAAVAQTRYAQLCGVYPQIARGTALPTVMTRASAAYLRRDDASPVMHYVGAGHMRVEDWTTDAGYHPESAATQIGRRTEALDDATDWTEVANTTNANALTGPHGQTTIDAVVTADAATDTQHGWQQVLTLTAASYAAGFFACKKGAQDWLYLADDTVANCWCYFDLANGVVGNKGAGVAAHYITSLGSGIYICEFTFTGTAAAHTFSAYASDADDNAANPAFVGDGASDEVYAGMWQVEPGKRLTSYIPNTGSGTVTRVADALTYKGDDGNVANNGVGMFCYDALVPSPPAANAWLVNINDGGSSADRIAQYLAASNGILNTFSAATGGNGGGIVGDAHADGVVFRGCCRWRTDSMRQYVDGSQEGSTDTSVDIPDDIDAIDIGMRESNLQQLGGLISNVEIEDRD